MYRDRHESRESLQMRMVLPELVSVSALDVVLCDVHKVYMRESAVFSAVVTSI